MTDTLRAVKSLLDSTDARTVCFSDGVAHKYKMDAFEVLIRTYGTNNNVAYGSVIACERANKASAVLMVLCDADEVFARSITKDALRFLMDNKTPCYFSKIEDSDDPYDTLLLGEDDIKNAYDKIKQKYIEGI